MLKKRLIPTLLLRNGRMVKGANFTAFRDVGHPVTTAKIYDAQGADELIFLDIEASQENRKTLFDVVSQVAEHCFMPLTVGGGVRSVEDFRLLLLAGADKVSINTAAFERPTLIVEAAEKFGRQCVVVSIDTRSTSVFPWEVFTHAGQKSTGMDALNWARRAASLGAGEILITSIDREGTSKGYDLELVKTIANALDIPVIASGGVGNLWHLVDGINIGHASAVAAASIFHFTDQSVIKAKTFMKQASVDIRW